MGIQLFIAGLVMASGEPVDVRGAGAFGFPQERAAVLCDTGDLRVSWVCDDEHLYVQAVLWGDGDDTPGLTADGRDIGDGSVLALDIDADRTDTSEIDRDYSLNPWPSLPGLHYSISMGEGASTGLQRDSQGRGSINYVETDGGLVRVECFLVPLEEIGVEPGATIRMAYWASSPHPAMTLNSVGFERERRYYAHHLPHESYHEVALGAAGFAADDDNDGEDDDFVIDLQAVPEGRETIAVERPAPADPPAVGAVPPEVSAASWKNWESDDPPTLAGLRGKVVVVEFWATWCGPCVAGIPHLNELYERYADDGLVILSLTDQALVGTVEEFASRTEMNYVVGFDSDTSDAYGVTGIPHAFVVGRDGVLRWHGHPADDAFDAAIVEALAEGRPGR